MPSRDIPRNTGLKLDILAFSLLRRAHRYQALAGLLDVLHQLVQWDMHNDVTPEQEKCLKELDAKLLHARNLTHDLGASFLGETDGTP